MEQANTVLRMAVTLQIRLASDEVIDLERSDPRKRDSSAPGSLPIQARQGEVAVVSGVCPGRAIGASMKIRRRDGVPAPEGDVLVLAEDRAGGAGRAGWARGRARCPTDGRRRHAGFARRRSVRPPTATARTLRTGTRTGTGMATGYLSDRRRPPPGRQGRAPRPRGCWASCSSSAAWSPRSRSRGAPAAGGVGHPARRDARQHGLRRRAGPRRGAGRPLPHAGVGPAPRHPDPAALALIPEEVARETWPSRFSFDGDVLRVAVAEPTDEVRPPDRDERAPGPAHARAPDRHPPGHRQQLPGHRRRRQAGPGLRGGGRHAQARRRPSAAPKSWPTTPRSSRSSTASSPRPCATAPPTCTSSRHEDVVRVRYRIDGALKDDAELPAAWVSGWSAASRSWPA